MDEIFTIKAVREVLTEGFSNAKLGPKKSSNILPLVKEPRRGEYFPPDVGYRYWHKKEIKITPSDFLKGLSLLLDFGESPLHMAIISRSASVDFISLLILGGVDVNLENKSGNTALYEAVKHTAVEVVELILEIEDVDVNKTNTVYAEGGLYQGATRKRAISSWRLGIVLGGCWERGDVRVRASMQLCM
jgi:hypothetical protein